MALYSENLIPLMTSDTAPAPYIATASSQAGSGTKPYMAFNRDIANFWRNLSGVFPHWLKIDVGNGNFIKVNKYTITTATSTPRCPMSWILQGSNDNTTWDNLHIVTNETNWAVNESRDFFIANSSNYQYIRLYITSSVSDANYVDIAKLELFENIEQNKYLVYSDNNMYTFVAGEWVLLNSITSNPSATEIQLHGLDDLISIPNEKWDELIRPIKILAWTSNTIVTSSTITYTQTQYPEKTLELTVPEHRLIDQLDAPISIVTYTDAETTPSLLQQYDYPNIGARILKRG